MSARLERRYRRLMRAYPRHYRAGHGSEIVTTLLDLAEAGHARPGAGQMLHLVLCGLRQRFRLPARRPLAWVAAVLAAVVLGGFGSAAGTWLGWRTAAPVPSAQEMWALNTAVTGMSASSFSWVASDTSAMGGPSIAVRATGAGDYSAERIRTALSAAGWHLTSFEQEASDQVAHFGIGARQITIPPGSSAYFKATKGATKLSGSGTVTAGLADSGVAGQADYRIDVWPQEPLVVRPLTVAGVFVGAMMGWLLVAAGAYRVRGSGRIARRIATVLSTAGFAAAILAAYQQYCDAYQVMVYAHGSPEPYIVYGPGDPGVAPACAVIGLLAFVAAFAVARPRRTSAALALPQVHLGETAVPDRG
jgi:hypothetical protein